MFWKRKKTPEISREQSLEAVVLQNPSIHVKEKEGIVTLAVPFQAPPWIQKISNKIGGGKAERTIELDEIGTFVWGMCDGKTTIKEMIQCLAERHKLNRKEAEVALTTFVRTLASKGLVGIIVRK